MLEGGCSGWMGHETTVMCFLSMSVLTQAKFSAQSRHTLFSLLYGNNDNEGLWLNTNLLGRSMGFLKHNYGQKTNDKTLLNGVITSVVGGLGHCSL